MDFYTPLRCVKQSLTTTIEKIILSEYNMKISTNEIYSCFGTPKQNFGELNVQFFRYSKLFKSKPINISKKIAKNMIEISSSPSNPLNDIIQQVTVQGPYINIFLKLSYMANNLKSSFFSPKKLKNKKSVMIEYSQPNTHKAFHVGHMRNVAVGNSLIRLYEQIGYNVVAVNYYGDEGSHVAKCLWLLQKILSEKELSTIPTNDRGEFLGNIYSKAVELLDLNTYTKYPIHDAISAKIKSLSNHPLDQKYCIITLSIGENKSVTVIDTCKEYSKDEIVIYIPCGIKFKGKMINKKVIKGCTSEGFIMKVNDLPSEMNINKNKHNIKYILPDDSPIGKSLIEIGRISYHINEEKETNEIKNQFNLTYQNKINSLFKINKNKTIKEVLSLYKLEVNNILKSLENNEENEIKNLYKMTRKWSLDEFKSIYKWLNVRFDHDYFESGVSDDSRKLIQEYYKKGIFEMNDNCIGLNLKEENLGFCILLKSDGSGLYATKDLKLAHDKFMMYDIEESIYVVDIAQTFHFKQIFATLKRIKFKHANNCVHVAYELVTIPSGKMSSRKGTIIVFSKLVKLLQENLRKKCFQDVKDEYWTEEKIENALHTISIGTIFYGMLNQDVTKKIVFDLENWTNPNGNTGSYLMYQYTRIVSILKEVEQPDLSKLEPNFELLTHKHDRFLLFLMNTFWDVIERAVEKKNPMLVCAYLYNLCKTFSSWYRIPENNLKRTKNKDLKITLYTLILWLKECMKQGMYLIGVETLDKM